MKAILIFVVTVTIAIILFIKVGDFKKSAAIDEARAEYENYTSKTMEEGSFLDKVKLQAKIEKDFDSFLIEEEVFKHYLSPNGYRFDLQNLSKEGSEVVENEVESKTPLFTVDAGVYGPLETADWRTTFQTPITKKASESLIASKALRSLREWVTHLDVLNDTIYDLTKKNTDVGLGFSKFRSLSTIEKDAIYKQIEGYYKANCSYGRLELSRSKSSQPYDIALDLIALQNIIFSEVTQQDEVEFAFRLETILLSYLDHLRRHNPSVVFLEKIQRALADYSKLDAYFFNNFNVFRSTLKEDIEVSFDALTKRRRLSDNFLDETFVLTEYMKYKGQFIIYNALEKIAFNTSKGAFYDQFNLSIYMEFKDYIEKDFFQKEDDEVFVKQVLSKLNMISEKVYDYAKVRLKRDEMSILMAVERYNIRTGSYPKSLSEISGYDQPYDITNMITGEAYTGDFVNNVSVASIEETSADKEIIDKPYDLKLTLGSDHVLK